MTLASQVPRRVSDQDIMRRYRMTGPIHAWGLFEVTTLPDAVWENRLELKEIIDCPALDLNESLRVRINIALTVGICELVGFT